MLSTEEKLAKRRAYFREYYKRKKETDQEWYRDRVKKLVKDNNRRYHERQLVVFNKHASELAKMTTQEDITKYLVKYFKLRGDKNE